MKQQLNGKNWYFPALVGGAAVLAVMMSGCSSNRSAGGGGGGGTPPAPDTRFSSVVQQSGGIVSSSAIAGVANAVAVSGSGNNDIVVQSSDASVNDITVTASYNDDGTISYVVRSTVGDWTFNSGDPGTGVSVLSRRKAEGWNAISLLLETDAGRRWVDVYTDIEPPTGDPPTPDTDYLSGGIWVYVPKKATAFSEYEFGVFVHGSDPFDNDNLAGLTGTAKYEGDASGLYSDPGSDSNAFFSAMAELTANFEDSGAGSETISGRIHSFMIGGKDVMDLELMLGEADLTAAAPPGTGLFTGTTSATYDDGDFAGKWGGRFYGDGENDDDQPGSVAGTFGAADDDDRTFIGVFGAHRQSDN
ncbi:MAG: hypothetical protein OXF88_07995 [Rhodobacteraceae bacterium]|nr:hypothetical protein [Paracoccaceae bacterium]MCY4137275.1 hypothetical protein [Paracoccaceae bacterium]